MLKTIEYLLREINRLKTNIKYAEGAIKDHQKGIFAKSSSISEMTAKVDSMVEAVQILQEEFGARTKLVGTDAE